MKETSLNQYPEGYLDDSQFTEPVTYELISLRPDPDNAGKHLGPYYFNIPAYCQTVFRGKSGKESPQNVRIGYVNDVDPNGNVIFSTDLNFGLSSQHGPGRITVNPDRGEIDKWRYLEHCSFNESSPYRRPQDPVFFRKIDHEKTAIDKAAKRRLLKKAMDIALGFTDKQALSAAALLNPNQNLSNARAREAVESLAETQPERFINLFENTPSEDGDALYYAKEAISSGIVKKNTKLRTFVWSENDAEITGYRNHPTAVKDLAEFVENDEAVFKKIKALVDAGK